MRPVQRITEVPAGFVIKIVGAETRADVRRRVLTIVAKGGDQRHTADRQALDTELGRKISAAHYRELG